MEKYILILLTLLVLLVIVVLFFGYKKLNYLSVDVARNTKNIIAIQSLLSNHSFLDRDDDHYNDRSMRGENERKVKFSDNEHNGVGLPKEIDLDDLDDNDDDNDDNDDKSSDELGDEEDYDEVHSVVLEVSDDERGTQLSSENSTTETKDKPHNKNVSLSDFLEQVGDTEEEKEEKEEKEDKEEEEQVSPSNEDDQEDNHSEGEETPSQDVKIIEIKSKKTKGKNIPNDDVNELDVGETRLSENDGKLYEVVQNKNGTKRWKLSK